MDANISEFSEKQKCDDKLQSFERDRYSANTHTPTHTKSMAGPAVWSHNVILVWESGWFWWCAAGRGSIITAQFGSSAAVRCVYSGF